MVGLKEGRTSEFVEAVEGEILPEVWECMVWRVKRWCGSGDGRLSMPSRSSSS